MAFTITEKKLEDHMFGKLQPNEISVIKRVYVAGMKVLFSTQTHDGVMKELEQALQTHPNDVGSVLGSETAHMMMLLFNESKGTMPKGALIPAGTLLLAKGCEFLNDTHVRPMTDAIFADAAHMMSTVLQSKFDPSFNSKIGAPAGATPSAPQTPPQPAGLLAQAGAQ